MSRKTDPWYSYWKPGEQEQFTDALRHTLGLSPIPGTVTPPAEYPPAVFTIPIMSGNRHVSSNRPAV